MIKNKVSSVASVTPELINQDKLDPKLSVKSVTLSKSEVVVKGSESALEKIASIKALVDLDNSDLNEARSHDIDNVKLVAYDNSGEIIHNVEIVPSSISATVVLDSYSKQVPLEIKTKGSLVAGKSIASILINNKSQNDYTITVYGSEEAISNITSIPVTFNIDGWGNDNTKTVAASITKPNGVRYMSESTVNVAFTFGNEQQKELSITDIKSRNLGSNLEAGIKNTNSENGVKVIAKGVPSVINDLKEENIYAYVDLTGLGVGVHDVEVKIDNNNSLVNYVVSSTITVEITSK